MEAWRPIEGETPKAFHAFELFRDIGPDRTLAQAAAMYYGDSRYLNGTKAVPGQIRKWSVDNRWFARAAEYDDRIRLIERDAVERHLSTRATNHEERRARLREMIMENGIIAAQKERAMLDSPLYRVTEYDEEHDDEITRVIVHNPAGWNFNSAARLHAIAMQAAGDVPEIAAKTVDLTQATDAQLERIANGEDAATVMRDSDDGASLDLDE